MHRILSSRRLPGLLAAGVSAVCFTAADAADLYSGGLKDAPAYVAYNWSGFYGGTNSGGVIGTGHFSDPLGTSIYGDDVTSSGAMFGGQIGYNKQAGNMVWGLEADAEWADAQGNNTCLAYSGDYVSADCRVQTNAFGTIAGRIGVAAGPEGRTLLYAKGGGAWTSNRVTVTNGNQFYGTQDDLQTVKNYTAWGWMVGAGVERALTPRWSVKAEYNFLDFGTTSVDYPRSMAADGEGYVVVAGGTNELRDQKHVFKVGANYHFGVVGPDWSGTYASPFDLFGGAASLKDAPSLGRPGWSYEFGARYWASTGKFQWDNKNSQPANQSRLTYNDMEGNSGELFARVDTPYNIFLKGAAGLGKIDSGTMNDEDWGIGQTNYYSNTVSSEKNGTLGYATADLGLDLLRGSGYRVGPFVGFTYYTDRADSMGCTQIAAPSTVCGAGYDTSILVGTQSSEWAAVRLGGSADYSLGYGFRLTTDAAWLVGASYRGRDNHLLRDTTTYFDQRADNGQGVQIEAILNYDFANKFSVGLGGRYWSFWGDGTFTCTGCGGAGVTSDAYPAKLYTERYGLLVQGSYKLGSGDEPLPAAPLK